MRNRVFLNVMVLFFSVSLSGCLIRSYTIKQPRIDQGLEGNRGYMGGKVPAGALSTKERKPYREHKVIEIEFVSKYDKAIPEPKEIKAVEIPLNEPLPEPAVVESAQKPQEQIDTVKIPDAAAVDTGKNDVPEVKFDTYEVKLGDTLQKISQKEYGTWKKWRVIYEANKDKLKIPDKVLAGQKLKIPR